MLKPIVMAGVSGKYFVPTGGLQPRRTAEFWLRKIGGGGKVAAYTCSGFLVCPFVEAPKLRL